MGGFAEKTISLENGIDHFYPSVKYHCRRDAVSCHRTRHERQGFNFLRFKWQGHQIVFFFFPDTRQTQRSWLKWHCVVERVTGQKHPQMPSTKRHWNFTWNKLTFFPRRKCSNTWIILFWRTLKVHVACFVRGGSSRARFDRLPNKVFDIVCHK